MTKIKLLAIIALSTLALTGGHALASIGTLHKGSPENKPGMLVSINGDGSVVPATPENTKTLFGVVISYDAKNNPEHPVEVVTSGRAEVAVNNMHGDIKKGDPISVSSTPGIGAKNIFAPRTIGIAQEDFDTDSPDVIKSSVELDNGQKRDIAYGLISVGLGVADYSSSTSGDDRGYLPQPVYGVLDSLAGRQISTLRATLALLVVLMGIITTAFLVYSSVQTSISAIGRNPLAAKNILTSLLWVFAASAAIGLTAIGLVLLILRVNF